MDKAQFLLQSPILDRAGLEAVQRAVLRAAQIRCDRREPLWSPGDPVTALYWVRSGVVCERLRHETGREFILGFHGRGEMVGEVPALSAAMRGEGRHTTTAEVHEEATLYRLGLDALVEQLRGDWALGFALAAITADKRQRSEARLACAVYRSAQARLAAAVISLAESFGVRDSRGVIINLRLTHRDLAALAGASRETASVALLDWRRDGLVEIDSKRVVVLDEAQLERVALDGTRDGSRDGSRDGDGAGDGPRDG